MPTLAHVPHGKITALWGTAFVRSPNGKMRLLKLGDVVNRGDVILTSQDGIVQISGEDGEPRAPRLALVQAEGAEPKAAPVPDDIEQVIQALNSNDPSVAPAAGVAGGGEGGELSPGLRVDRVIEVVTPQEYAFSTPDRTAAEFTTGNQIDGSAAAAGEPARPGPFSGAEDSRIPVALVADGTTATSVTVTSLPPGSTLFLADGVTPVAAGQVLTPAQAAGLVFVPAPDFNGATQIGFSTTDAQGNLTPATSVAVTVTPVNDAPVAAPDAATALEDTPLSGKLLANDGDVDGDALSITGFSIAGLPGAFAAGSTASLAGVGTFTLAADGSYTFTPAPQYNGPVPQVTYTVSDGTASTTGTLALSVTPVNDAPVAVGDSVATNEDTPVTIAVLGNDSDADGDALAVTAINGTAIAVGSPVLLPQGSVSLNADGTLTFTPAADYNGPASFDYTVSDGQGGSSTASVTVTVNPVADVTTVSLAATPAVAEGGTIVYTASLTGPAQAPLTLTLSNGAVISIAAGASSGSVAVPAPADDAYLDAGSVSATIARASGGGFEQLAVNPAAATTAVTDTQDTTTLSLTASPNVAEGGQITYTATLTSVAQTPVTVTLSNGAVITIAAGASTGAVSVPAPTDDVHVDAGSVSATIASASGGNFEQLHIDPVAATTSVADTIDTTTVSLTASPSAAEGGQITYTASLTAAAQSPVTVTLSNGATITIAAGASTGSVAVPAPADDTYLDAGSVSATIASASGGGFEQLAVNPAAATTAVTDTTDATTVSLTASSNVAEGGQITYTASLTGAAQTPVTVTLSNGAVIVIPAGASTGSVNVGAPADDLYLDAGSVSATIASASGGSFEQLHIDPAAATTSVADTLDTTTVSLTASPSAAEGGQITYTASLTSAAQTPVTVMLTNGATITIAAGASAGSVSVNAPADDAYADAGSVSASIASASGGNFEDLVVSPAPAVTAITDTTDTTTISLGASPSVAEGGQITYTASLTAPAQSPVTVTLSNGAVITIAAGASTGSVNVSAPADDVYVDAGSVSATIASATGGNFEQIALNPAAAATTITDTLDATTVSLTASPSVAEGGTIVYTAGLTAPALSPVTVTLSNGATITIAAGASTGSVAVPAPADDTYLDAGSVSATIASASGGGFEQLAVNPAAATTTVTDTTDATTVSLTASSNVAEGGQITYTASLTGTAQTPVTVTLSNGAVIVIPAGASTGSVNVGAPTDDLYLDAGSVSATIASASGGNFEQLQVDPAAATTAVSDTLDTTTLSLGASPAVAEGGSIVYTASLTAPAQTAVTVTLSNGAVITIAAGASSGMVSVPAPADDVHLDAGSVSATIASASGGNFEQLHIDPAAATTSVADTIDTTTVSLTASPSVAEGGQITYTASLTSAAQTPVTVMLTNGASITIAAGASTGSVSVPAPANDVYTETVTTPVVVNARASLVNGVGARMQLWLNGEMVGEVQVDNTTYANHTFQVPGQVGRDAQLDVVFTNDQVSGGQDRNLWVSSVTVGQHVMRPSDAGVVIDRGSGAQAFDGVNTIAGQTGMLWNGALRFDVPASAFGVASVSAGIASASGGNFENLVVNGTPAATTVTEVVDTTTVSLTASPSVAEGGQITYTASLTSAAQTAVTVTLTNGAVITIPAGASSGSVSVSAPAEDVYADAGTVSAGIASAAGGNFEQLAVNPATATTAVTDTTDTTTVSLAATPSVAEGGQITYTASLTAPAQGPVTVTLSNGASITIAAGASTGSVSVNAPADDVYADAGNVSATITGATGGGFEQLAVNPAAASTAVSDTQDTTTVSLTGSPSVAEGGQITYTASLTAPAQSPVTVTLSNGAVITIHAGSSTGSVSVPAPADDAHADGSTVSVTIGSAAGGRFEQLAVNPAAVDTTITDTVDTTTLSLSATPAVAEGGFISYTASLTAPAQTAMLVTLSNGSTITIAAGASTGSVSVPAPADDVYTDAGNLSVQITGASGGNFEQLSVSATPAVTAVSDTQDTTTVSLSATPAVAEGGQITYTATLGAPAQTAMVVALSNGASISIPAGSSVGSVSVPAPAEDVYADAGSVSVQITSASGGNFEQLSVDTTPAVTSVSDTQDTTTVSLSASPTVAEGGQITYTASLGAPAQSPVTVTLSNGATITIAAGSSTGSASLPAPGDDVYADGSTLSVTITGADGGGFERLEASPTPADTTVTDTPNTTTVSLAGSGSVAEGGTASYTVSLTSPAATAVTVTLAYSGTAADGTDFTGVATLTIPAGASSAGFDIATLNDTLAEGAENFTVSLVSAAGGNFESLVVSGSNGSVTTGIVDDDAASLSLSATPALTEAGGTITYTATLTEPPVSPLSVTLSNGATITIAAGALSGTVDVPLAAADDVYVDPGSVSTAISGISGGGIAVVVDATPAVTTIGDTIDSTTVSLSATPVVAEGGSIVYTASLTAAAQSPVSVTLSNGATITIAAGASSGSVSLAAGDDVYAGGAGISARISSATGGNFENLVADTTPADTTVTDTVDTTTLSLTASGSAAEGGQISYTASLTRVAQSPVTVTLSNGAILTIPAGSSSATVDVAAPTDDVYLDAGSVSATITSASGGGFEQLAIDPAAAGTTITDTPDSTTVSLAASPSVAEGGQIIYTASLTSPAQSDVAVALSNGAVITIAAGSSSGSVSVNAPGDDVYLDAGNVSATITSATGGNFENLLLSPAAATTTVTDTTDTTTVSLTATPTVAEGGQITYTASLTAPARSAVTVALSNGATITIPAGASSASVGVNAPADDVYADAGNVSATISSAAGGGFEHLAVNPAAATTGVTDTVDDTTVSLSATPTVAEGGQITYTASLGAAAQAPVTVTLSNGAVITIAAGSSSGSVSLNAPADDVYTDAGTVSATINGATGGGFERLVVNPAAATTAVTDTVDTTTVSLSATPSVSEGGQITYTASLTSAAGTPVTVTLSNGATITIAAGANTGSVSVNAPGDDVYTDAGSVSATITGATGGNFENLVVNPAAAATTVTDTPDDTTVSLAATPTVAEGGQITYTASLTAAAQSPVTVTLSNGAVITIPAGASSASVSVNAPGEDVYLDAGSVSATITSATGGGFENLVASPTAAGTTVTDTVNDSTVSLTASPTVAEGGSITYTASLTSPAQTPVTVTLSNGAVITIAAGASSGTANVVAADDVYQGGGSVSATIAGATGGNFENLLVNPAAAGTTITDTATDSTVTLSASPSVAEGGQITYTASLTSPAQTPVTVTLSNGAVITIPAGDSTGAVSVNAPADDVYLDAGSVSATIASATGGNFENLLVNPAAATTTVSDTTDTATVSLAASPSVAEGGQVTYTASLTAPAQTAVTVTLDNGAVITIAAGASSGSVNVAAPTDDVYLDAGSVSASIASASGGNFEQLVVNTTAATTTITDTTDMTTVSLTASSSVAEGGQITYTASLTAPAQTPVTVTLSNGATISIAAGASTGTVSLNAPADDVYADAGTVSATITGATGGSFEQLAINPAAATTAITDTANTTTVSLSASASVAEGGQIVYTASLTSAAQAPVTVTLSNGAVITIPAGSSSASVNVDAPTDDVYLDAGSVSATISSASGGNFENLVINTTAASTTVSDTLDDTTVSLSATPSVAEGGQITYTASLTAAAQTPVTVQLSNGATITIAAGASTGSVSVPAPAEDVYADAGNVSATIASATGGNFENLVVSTTAAVTSVADTVDTTTVSLTATATVAEGGQIVYTASLTSAAQGPVTVTLSNGATIEIAAGASSGSVSVAAPADDVYTDAGNVSATISGASGGNFENLVVSNTAAVTAVTDDADATTLSLTGASSVTEGGSATYTLSLTSPAQTAVTVTLGYSGTAANGSDYTGVTTVTIPAGSSSVSFGIATLDDSATESTESFTVSLLSATGGSFENLLLSGSNSAVSTSIIDNDAPPAIDLDANNSSGAAGTGYAATFTENGAAVAIADADVAITDVDSTSLTGATITLTNAQAGDVLAAGVLPAGISASVSGNTVTLSGAASLASYQTAIRAITFTNTGENPSTTPRSISVTVTDGTSSSNTAITTVNVVAVNDAPVNSVPAAQTTAEDSARVFSSANGNAITVADADAGSLTVTVSVTSGTLSAAAFAGATVSNNGTGSITITGSAAAINGALNGLAYNPVADYNGSVTLTVSTSDGVAAPVVSSVPITVTPVADITGDTVSTNEDTAVTVAVLATDSFENAGRAITAVNGTAITAGGPAVAVANGSVQLNAGGTLTFTPAANYNGPASFTYTVTSGGVTETATVNVTVNAVNDAPVLDLDDNNSSGATGANYTATFTENGSAVSIGDADVRITDVDGATLAGATITLTNAQAGDVLAAGALPAGISATVSGNSVTLSGSASLAAYETAIRAITFSNTSENPGTTPRTIQVTVNDGVNGSNVATATVNVVSVNDAPVAVATPASGLEDAAFIAVNLAGTDVDGSIASVRVTALPANGTLFLADGVTQVVTNAALTPAQAAALRFVPAADWSGSTQLSFTVTDNQGLTSAAVQNPITVTPVADQPVLASWTTTHVNVSEDWQDNNTSVGQMVWTSSDGFVEVNTQPAYNSLQNPNTTLTPANNRVAEIEADPGTANWIQTTINVPLADQVIEISFDALRRTLSGTTDSNTQSFNVIWNGTVVGTYNPGTGAWLSPTIQVTSVAGTNTLRFSSTDQTGSIGAVLDHVSVRTVADGFEDSPVRLPSLAGAALVFGDSADDSEQHTLALSGIPVGATLSDGTRSFTATAGNTSVLVFNEDNPAAASGGANWNLATLTITPPANFFGNLSLTATATAVELANGSTASASSTIDLVIAPVNDAPAGAADAASVTEGSTTLQASVLANDSDVEGDALTVSQVAASAGGTAVSVNGSNTVTTALGGTVTMNADGSYTYVAPAVLHDAANTPVQDSFVYRANDGDANSGWTTVTISLADSTPTAVHNDATVVWGQSVSGNLLSNDVAVDGGRTLTSVRFDGVDYAVAASGTTTITTPDGALVVSANGNYTYTSRLGGTASISGNSLAQWESQIDAFGFDNNDTSWASGSNLNVNALTSGAGALVTYGGGGIKQGLRVVNAGIESDEQLIVRLPELATNASVSIAQANQLANTRWYAYDADGVLVDQGDFLGASNNGTEYTVAINTPNPFTYLQLSYTGSNSQGFVLSGLSYSRVSTSHGDLFQYTMRDADGDTSTSTLDVELGASNQALTSGALQSGTEGADTLTGSASANTIMAHGGDDIVNAGGGNDWIAGGAGNDQLNGQSGNDVIYGGAGNDVLAGGTGADVFAWQLADRGSNGAPAVDTITDFSISQGDVLDLRDLLQGHDTSAANIDNYIDIDYSGGNTVIRISSSGGFANGNYSASAQDQQIVLQGVDLRDQLGLGSSTTESQLLQELMHRGKLLTEP
ncbi:immunoglobulin-like domain-containing protein [Methylibium rhizosphaerae]|uniref:immunoglobulin-like domain-containing protein n=1 Tax=Methylibium rhizosphaerae TaxID=2570323 RepID=UPI00112A66B0|nr:immunoglobulin-like domain-containing protein [Methylibium rhizosphaerae]